MTQGFTRRGALAWLVVLFSSCWLHGEELADVSLTDTNYEKWRDYVLPTADELAYKNIDWRPSFWEAVIEAQAKEMPILLWTMNGHPLCNT